MLELPSEVVLILDAPSAMQTRSLVLPVKMDISLNQDSVFLALMVAKLAHQPLQLHALPAWLTGIRPPMIPALNVQDYARHVQELETIVLLAIKDLSPVL